MCMMHNNLVSFYEKIFAFVHYHKWSLAEIEDLMPWEFDVMTSFLNNYLETKELARKQSLATRG